MGTYDLWLPGFAGTQTRFYLPDPETTLTIPSTARYAITVGAYNPRFQSYADFSGRGYTRFFQDIKPDLCAPGVDISAPVSGGGYLFCRSFRDGKRGADDGMGNSLWK